MNGYDVRSARKTRSDWQRDCPKQDLKRDGFSS